MNQKIVNQVETKNVYESEIQSLKREMTQLENELNRNKELYDRVQGISRYMEIEDVSQEDIENANLISEGTPLEFETAMILMLYAKNMT